MRVLSTIILLVLLPAAGMAQTQFINRIGVYATETPFWPEASVSNPETNIHTPEPGFLDVHVVCVNPYNTAAGRPIAALGGYEFNLVVDLAWFLTTVTLPADVLDFDASNDAFYCSGLIPVIEANGNRVAHLATLRLYHLGAAPGVGLIYLEPYFLAPSIPDRMALTDAYDNFSLHAADPSSWFYEAPVCYINYFWDPPEEKSWGEVKALYR